MRRYLVVFVFATAADFVAAVHIYTIARDWVAFALASGLMLGNARYADAPALKERLAIRLCTAAGVVAGSAIALLCFRR